MVTALINNGKAVIRNGKLVTVTDADDAAACECCGAVATDNVGCTACLNSKASSTLQAVMSNWANGSNCGTCSVLNGTFECSYAGTFTGCLLDDFDYWEGPIFGNASCGGSGYLQDRIIRIAIQQGTESCDTYVGVHHKDDDPCATVDGSLASRFYVIFANSFEQDDWDCQSGELDMGSFSEAFSTNDCDPTNATCKVKVP